MASMVGANENKENRGLMKFHFIVLKKTKRKR